MSWPLAGEVTDLVWIQTSFIGDIVLSTAAVEAAAAALPGVKQHMVTTTLGIDALTEATPLASLVPFHKKKGSLLQTMRGVKDALAPQVGRRPVILQPHRSFRSSLLAKYLGWPTATYRESDFPWMAHRRVPRVAVLHETARIGLLLETLGVARAAIVAARPRLKPGSGLSDATLAAELTALSAPLAPAHAARRRPLVGIAPGSVWGTKKWRESGFAAVAAALAMRGAGIVFIGSKAERPLCESLYGQLPNRALAVNAAGRTTLADLRTLYPALALLVGNDSSALHFAAAFDVPTVAVFGATVPAMGFSPSARRARVVEVDGLACRPCGAHGPATCPLGHFKCMNDLPPDRVIAACVALLEDTP